MRRKKGKIKGFRASGRKKTYFGSSYFVCFFIQLRLDFSGQSLLTLVTNLVGFLLLFLLMQKQNVIRNPLPSLTLIGFGLSYFYLPVVARTVEGSSVVEGLDNPVATMLLALSHYIFFIGAYLVASKTTFGIKGTRFLSTSILQPFGVFKIPSKEQLLFFGGVGFLTSAIYVFTWIPGTNEDSIGPFLKLARSLGIFLLAPFFLFLPGIMGARFELNKRLYIILSCYFVILVILAVSYNRRILIFEGIASLLIGFALVYFLKSRVTSIKAPRKFLWMWVGAVLAVPILSQLALAMVFVRDQRNDLTRVEILSETLRAVGNSEAIDNFVRDSADKDKDWNERYLRNIFLNRVCNLKFTDNAISEKNRLTERQKELITKTELEKILCIFPSFVLEKFNIRVDKDYLMSFSMGDYLHFQDGAHPSALGGFRTGSMLVSGVLIFGSFSPLMLGIFSIPIFIMFNSLSFSFRSGNEIHTKICLIGLISLFKITFFLTSAATGCESFVQLMLFLVRSFWELLFIYAIVYWSFQIVSAIGRQFNRFND
jgi:ABC-type multidrug transport system fused ATPase/permease subunit